MASLPFIVVRGHRYSKEEWDAEVSGLEVITPAARVAELAARGGSTPTDETREAVDRMVAGLVDAKVPPTNAQRIAVNAANRHDRTRS